MSVTVEVSNETSLSIAEDTLAALGEEVLRLQEAQGVLAVALVTEAAMSELNLSYRGHEGPTDVLSFAEEADPDWPSSEEEPHLGDVVICPAYASAYAAEEGVSLDEELTRLLVHGILHVLGWDHENDSGQMLALENGLLARLERRPLVLGPS